MKPKPEVDKQSAHHYEVLKDVYEKFRDPLAVRGIVLKNCYEEKHEEKTNIVAV